MVISTQLIQELRDQTGAGVMEAKKALEEAGGSFNEAVKILKKRGEKKSEAKSSRSTNQGIVDVYRHSNNKIASVIVLLCETDFVARTETFQSLAHDLAMQVAAAKPHYLSPEDVPAEVIEKEKASYLEEIEPGKPEAVKEKIITGKLNKYYREHCLLSQVFIKDETKTVAELLSEAVAKLGENIKIRSYGYYSV